VEKIKKNLILGLFAVFALITTALLPATSVSAYSYHGLTYDWDRDGHSTINHRGTVFADSSNSTGYLETTGDGWVYADAYLNSAHVDAVADVDHVTVWVYWDDGYKDINGVVNKARLECKLYINGEYQALGISSYPASLGYAEFAYTSLDIDTGDDLDVDIKLVIDVGNVLFDGDAELYGTFDFVQFITY
jgi:hypothetical protein